MRLCKLFTSLTHPRKSLTKDQLYTGRQPFPDILLELPVIFHIINGGRQKRPTSEQCHLILQDAAWDIIERCWAQDPAQRPSMIQVERDLTHLHEGTDERGMNRRRSSSSKHRLSRRELVRLSVTIPPPVDADASLTPPIPRRSPSIHSLSRATPTAITALVPSSSDAEYIGSHGQHEGVGPPMHVRTGAQAHASDPPSSPLDAGIADILSVIDGNSPVTATDITDVQPQHPPSAVRSCHSCPS